MSAVTSQLGQPVWQLATLFPAQGHWTEEDYLDFDENILLEYADGYVEVLPMPTTSHQTIVLFLLQSLLSHIRPKNLGIALMAPLKLRVATARYREPDVLFLLKKNRQKAQEQFWTGADLLMEVVSPDDPDRDYIRKRRDYAAAGVAEYWIVDPGSQLITILKLVNGRYQKHGVFKSGDSAESALLKDFDVVVDECFASAWGV